MEDKNNGSINIPEQEYEIRTMKDDLAKTEGKPIESKISVPLPNLLSLNKKQEKLERENLKREQEKIREEREQEQKQAREEEKKKEEQLKKQTKEEKKRLEREREEKEKTDKEEKRRLEKEQKLKEKQASEEKKRLEKEQVEKRKEEERKKEQLEKQTKEENKRIEEEQKQKAKEEKKRLEKELETKKQQEKQEKKRLKKEEKQKKGKKSPIILIILLIVIILGGILYLIGKNQPEPPQPPQLPESLIRVDDTKILSLDENTSLFNAIINESRQSQLDQSIIRIGGGFTNTEDLIRKLDINVPDGVIAELSEKNTLVLYNQRLGLIFEIKNSENLKNQLLYWEQTMADNLKPIFLDKTPGEPLTVTFHDNQYKEINIRYINFPNPDLTIDYAVINNLLILSTSKESMYQIIDRIKPE